MNIVQSKKMQTGSVILEALISILIFSIGILALVGLQTAAVTNVADGKYRSTAGFLADQMVGTIWANRLGVLAANASNVMIASPNPTFACNSCAQSSVGNTYTQTWAASSVAAALPNPTTNIAINGPAVTITIGWQAPNDAVPHRHVVQTFIN
jgi:type IV pilus assembly protein PilV